MTNIKVPRRIIKKILRAETNRVPFIDMKNKLEIFAVKERLKPAYAGSRDLKDIDLTVSDNLPRLRQIARIVGLKCMQTNAPPLYFSKHPNVTSEFLDTFYNRTDTDVLWIYDNSKIKLKIHKCISGELNEGYILGYPKCCIRWHEERRVLEIESAFLQNVEKFQKIMDKHVLETYDKYPFVPHWACSACLSGASKRTEKLNHKYRELAASISHDFDKIVVQKVRQIVREFKKSKPSDCLTPQT